MYDVAFAAFGSLFFAWVCMVLFAIGVWMEGGR